MKKNYLKIEVIRNEEIKNMGYYLLTDNITGFTTELTETRLYFKNANPFSYIRLYMPYDNFERLMKKQIFNYNSLVEGSTFHYSVVEL